MAHTPAPPLPSCRSICGDAADERKWDKPGPMAKSAYKSGQTMDIDIIFAQNHLGRLQMRICPLDAKDEKQCTDLQRADGKVGGWRAARRGAARRGAARRESTKCVLTGRRVVQSPLRT